MRRRPGAARKFASSDGPPPYPSSSTSTSGSKPPPAPFPPLQPPIHQRTQLLGSIRQVTTTNSPTVDRTALPARFLPLHPGAIAGTLSKERRRKKPHPRPAKKQQKNAAPPSIRPDTSQWRDNGRWELREVNGEGEKRRRGREKERERAEQHPPHPAMSVFKRRARPQGSAGVISRLSVKRRGVRRVKESVGLDSIDCVAVVSLSNKQVVIGEWRRACGSQRGLCVYGALPRPADNNCSHRLDSATLAESLLRERERRGGR
uniref:Uncharacterized protein n=1 Tax=Plectus sambesii TaxID=2011161 RepID=A0A914WPI9_9BILA